MASEIALPGMIAAGVTIRRASVPQSLDDAAAKGPTWQLAGERFLLGIPGIARFLLSGGRDIAVEPEPQADTADIAVFIAGTVFGILLHQRGQIVLHASAVRVNGNDSAAKQQEATPSLRQLAQAHVGAVYRQLEAQRAARH